MGIRKYATYGWTKEGIETGKELVLRVLVQNKEKELSVVEVVGFANKQIGEIRIRCMLSLLVNENVVIMRRYAHNFCTFQLR